MSAKGKFMRRLKFTILNTFIFLSILSCISLPEGLSTKSEIYNADNVDFYYDLTYKKDGKIEYERQIWEQAYEILDNAKEFFLMDIFVFNEYLGKGVREKLDPIDIAEEFTQKILEKRRELVEHGS